MEDKCVYNDCCNENYEQYRFVDDIIDDLKNNTSVHCVIKRLEKSSVLTRKSNHEIGEWFYATDITY